MKKINIVKESREFTRIMNRYTPLKNKEFIVFLERKDNLTNYRFGISVSTKIGCAVVRNRLKRQIKAIIDEKDYQKNFNCIIILRKDVINKSFEEIHSSLFDILNRLNIIIGENYEAKN